MKKVFKYYKHCIETRVLPIIPFSAAFFVSMLAILVATLLVYYLLGHASFFNPLQKFANYVDLGVAFAFLATVAFIYQVVATREMIKNQIRPSVDVGLIYDDKGNPDGPGTRVQFVNITRVPAVIRLKTDLKIDGRKIGGPGKIDMIGDKHLDGEEIDIGPYTRCTNIGHFRLLTDCQHYKKICQKKNDCKEKEYKKIGCQKFEASDSCKYEGKEIEIVLKIGVAPIFDKRVRWKSFQVKRYKFDLDDKGQKQWLRQDWWGTPDKNEFPSGYPLVISRKPGDEAGPQSTSGS